MIELNSPAATSADEASAPYLGQWNRLVSTTNWEKGRIIHEWRQALIAAAAPAAEFADDAWSRRVGSVSGQHVGRLRRVHERFAAVREQYPHLYWSHFQAALDWDDAEMWLEGAVQSQWSVADMRRQRWETLGAVAGQQPQDAEIVSGELDEDSDPPADELGSSSDEATDRAHADRSTADDGSEPSGQTAEVAPFEVYDPEDAPAAEPRRPFAHLAELPDDLSEAFEAFKLAIVRHKLAGWQAIARDDLLAALDALRELALAPADLA